MDALSDFVSINQALALNASVQEISELIEKGSDLNEKDTQGRTPLFNAVDKVKLDIVRLLLTQDVELDTQDFAGNTPLLAAFQEFSKSEIINSRAAFEAAQIKDQNSVEIIKLLITAGANVNLIDSSGLSALHHASKMNFLDIGNLLLENGADANIKNQQGEIPLHTTFDLEYLKLLLEYGAKINEKDNDGNTLLFKAMRNNQDHIIDFLLSKGAKIDLQNSKGNTLLHEFVLTKKIEMVKFLIKNGANVDIKNHYNKSCYDIAAEHNDLYMISILKGRKFLVNNYLSKITDIKEIREIYYEMRKKHDKEICNYIFKKFGYKLFIDEIKNSGAKQTIIYIQGSDIDKTFEKLSNSMAKLITKKDVNFLGINTDNEFIGLPVIRTLIQEFVDPDSKVTVVLGMHGGPSLSVVNYLNNIIKDYLNIYSNFLDYFIPYHHMIDAHGNSDSIISSLFGMTNTANFLEVINEALNYRPYDVFLESCYGALAALDAYQILPSGSRFISKGEVPTLAFINSPIHESLEKVIDNVSANDFSLDFLLKLSVCSVGYKQTNYHTGVLTHSGHYFELKREAEKFISKHFKFDATLRELIHQNFKEVEDLCQPKDIHKILEETMNQFENGAVESVNFNAMITLTNELLNMQNDPSTSDFAHCFADL